MDEQASNVQDFQRLDVPDGLEPAVSSGIGSSLGPRFLVKAARGGRSRARSRRHRPCWHELLVWIDGMLEILNTRPMKKYEARRVSRRDFFERIEGTGGVLSPQMGTGGEAWSALSDGLVGTRQCPFVDEHAGCSRPRCEGQAGGRRDAEDFKNSSGCTGWDRQGSGDGPNTERR